jgi:hypothetical protein
MLLDQDRSGVAKVQEEGSKTVLVYRPIEREMVALGESPPSEANRIAGALYAAAAEVAQAR